MRYVVEVNARRKMVAIEPEGVRYEDDAPIHAELSDIEGSPVRMALA